MTDIMTMVRTAVMIPYYHSYDSMEDITFGEPFRKKVTIRYNRSNWVDIDMQPIKQTNIDADYVVTSQFYIFVI